VWAPSILVELEFLSADFVGKREGGERGGGGGESGEKLSEQGEHEPQTRPHWLKASVLTNAP